MTESERKETDAALEHFTEYFVRNYPGPTTIIHDPYWHAPKIFRAACYALEAARAAAPAPVAPSPVAAPPAGISLADRLDWYADHAAPGSTMMSDLYVAATFARKVIDAAPVPPSAKETHDTSELWVVWGPVEKDGARYPEFCAGWPSACHEHVNDAINEHGLAEAKQWIVRQARPLPSAPQETER